MAERNPGQMYYIQDTRQYVGNCVLWWRPGGKGYTTEIKKAGLYTEKEARDIEGNRGTDVAWERESVERCIVNHVRMEHLRDNGVPFKKNTEEVDDCLKGKD